MKKKKINFYDESLYNLKTRLKKNKISLNLFLNKNVLDFGCNNGNYSTSILKLGAKKVDAFDFKKKPKNFPKKINYYDNMLKLKKSDQLYDFIYCNGILSHKKNWKTIIKYLHNLLKRGGYLWISLYPRSQYWLDMDKISSKLNYKNKNNFSKLLKLRDWDEGKIYFLQDILFSKRIYFTKKNIKYFLQKNGFNQIKFLNRGLNTDLSEKVFKYQVHRKYFGDGEIRLIAKKNVIDFRNI